MRMDLILLYSSQNANAKISQSSVALAFCSAVSETEGGTWASSLPLIVLIEEHIFTAWTYDVVENSKHHHQTCLFVNRESMNEEQDW